MPPGLADLYQMVAKRLPRYRTNVWLPGLRLRLHLTRHPADVDVLGLFHNVKGMGQSGELVAMLCVRHQPYRPHIPPVVLRTRLVPGKHMESLHKFMLDDLGHTLDTGTCIWCRRRGGTCEDATGNESCHYRGVNL